MGIDQADARWAGTMVGSQRPVWQDLYRDFRGNPQGPRSEEERNNGEQWYVVALGLMQGIPWEPTPGREGIEIGSRVALPPVPAEVPPVKELADKEKEWRRPRIDKQDVTRFGVTAGCPGCMAATRGHPARGIPTPAGIGWSRT